MKRPQDDQEMLASEEEANDTEQIGPLPPTAEEEK